MLFSSITFIFLFLPVVLLLYYLLPKHGNLILLVFSLIFYAWGEPYYILIMLTTILINYVGARVVDKYHNKIMLAFFIVLNLSMLFYFKYFNFLIENINDLLKAKITGINVIMPIGISFYTFQALSYLIDVYKREVRVQKSLPKLALYISLFPQLVAGPIVKYHDVCSEIENRSTDSEQFLRGIKRFIIGLSKKVLIANTLGKVVDDLFILAPEQMDSLTAWCGALFYSLQLFFDFSGYSDMAIGIGWILGFHFLENFNYPYISHSITEFWRRWHISLSTWFRDYVYIPLGGNRKGKFRTYLNLFIVFLATGFWHGAAWTFLIWGIWHGFFIIIEKFFNWTKASVSFVGRTVQHIYLILVVLIGWVIFRSDTLDYAWRYIKNMFGGLKNTPTNALSFYLDRTEIIIAIIGILCSTPLFKNFICPQKRVNVCFVNIILLVLFVLTTTRIALSTYNPFIYFRF